MKTAFYTLPLLASVTFAGSTLAQQNDPIFTYPDKELTEEQLNQDKGECEMWTYEKIGFPGENVSAQSAGQKEVAMEVNSTAVSTIVIDNREKANETITDAAQRGFEQGRRMRERATVQKALKNFDEDPEQAIRTIRPIDPKLAMALEDRLDVKKETAQRQVAIEAQYNENYRRAMTACMQARGYTVN